MSNKYEQRKKMIYDFMCDNMYVPMKIKELAIVLGVKKEQRPELEAILAVYNSVSPLHAVGSRHSRRASVSCQWKERRRTSLFRSRR